MCEVGGKGDSKPSLQVPEPLKALLGELLLLVHPRTFRAIGLRPRAWSVFENNFMPISRILRDLGSRTWEFQRRPHGLSLHLWGVGLPEGASPAWLQSSN